MKILLIPIVVALFLTYASVHSMNIRSYLYGNSTFCEQPGYACKSCAESVLCMQNGTNFTEIPVDYCFGDYSCINGTCTTDYNPTCNNVTQLQPGFICQTPGMYPDPFDCTKYHYCITSNSSSYNETFNHYSENCGCNYYYNMKTTFCDKVMHNNTCEGVYPLAICHSAGQTGSFWQNPSLYYICRLHPYDNVLYPFMYACENGKKYNPETYLCR